MVDMTLPTRPSIWQDFKSRLFMHSVWAAVVVANWCIGEVYYA